MIERKKSPALVLLLSLVLGVGPTAAGFAQDGPEVGPNRQVSAPQQLFPDDFPGRNTATLAASDDGQDLLAGWDDLQGFCGPPTNRLCPPQAPQGLSGFAFSTDGGTTWTDGGSPFRIGATWTAGHPWVDRAEVAGSEFFFYTTRVRAGARGSAGLGVYRGHFGAGTFVWDDAQILNSTDPTDFYGRQAIAAAKDGSGSAYIVLSNIGALCGIPQFGFGKIEVWRTHDGGDTWQGPVLVSPDATDVSDPSVPECGLVGTVQTAPVPAIGTNGEVYLVWQFGPRFLDVAGNTSADSRLAFSRSLDGGATFAPPTFLVAFNNLRDNPPAGYAKNRMNDQPRIAVATTGPHRGRVYVAFYQSVQPVSGPPTAQSAVSSQIYLMYSDDQGTTWSAPAAIAGPVPPTGIKRFWPTIGIRPGGDVDVVYMESHETQVTPDPADVECNVPFGAGALQRRMGPLSSLVDAWWVQSRDGGATFGEPVRVSEETSNWCAAAFLFPGLGGALYSNFGDYLGVVSGGDRTLVVWPDGRNGFSDVYFAEIEGKVEK